CSEPDEDGKRKVFMRLNGQTRIIEIQDASTKSTTHENIKADKSNNKHIGAPLQGKISQLLVKTGDEVKLNQPLFIIEAMKMETTITANSTGKVGDVLISEGKMVKSDDLVLILD
ncbi:MAG TPA: biotin/lipoyl-containing protein, partial [Flavisolibacter sp.]|nr:biotin/lipoyl-containing protein [Flavisolibacter sp.]